MEEGNEVGPEDAVPALENVSPTECTLRVCAREIETYLEGWVSVSLPGTTQKLSKKNVVGVVPLMLVTTMVCSPRGSVGDPKNCRVQPWTFGSGSKLLSVL